MRVVTAQLAGGERNADRVFVTDDAVVVLDGATAFEPVDLDPGEYAEAIGREIVRRLPGATIADAVAGAIVETARAYDLREGQSPSSTVSAMRVREDVVDLYVLGDSPIHYGAETSVNVLHDDRLGCFASLQRAKYIKMLHAGHGYDEQHSQTMAALQEEQRRHRNRPGGYWIAETTPEAARHGFARPVSRSLISWVVVGTDGVADHLIADSGTDWPAIARLDYGQLYDILVRLHEWERDIDPDGYIFPRAKRHDDKTLATVRLPEVARTKRN